MTPKLSKNGIIVDNNDLAGDYHVLVNRNSNAYSSTLNQTNVKTNNNKFYIIQLLEHDSNIDDYIIYTRYGRIGNNGVVNKSGYCSKMSAIDAFESAFKKKTGNSWSNINNFVKKSGKYFMSQIDYGDDSDSDETVTKDIVPVDSDPDIATKPPEPECNLDSQVQSFLSLISNISLIKTTMREFNIDLRKMPLGKISKRQINLAYNVLRSITQGLDYGVHLDYEDLTSQFYTLIPSSFGRRVPPIIDNDDTVKKCADMLSVLTDLEVANTILKRNASPDGLHPITRIYNRLNTNLSALSLSTDSDRYKMIEKYVKNTVAPTHNRYKLELMDIIVVDREEERKQFKNYGNRMLLFHGSRVANFMGILSKGLRINNNAPKTGSMFGSGSYFSNSVTKSANYCCTDRKNNIGIVLLCEVSLGNVYKRRHSQYVDWLPNDEYQSTMGQGGSTPDPTDFAEIGGDGSNDTDKIIVPYGKLISSGIESNSLLYDEFIVYRENQVKIKYALKMRFKY